MDHHQIVEKALHTLRRDMDEKITAFNLLPDTFTMKELQKLYETIYNRPFVRTNFQKKILDLGILERLGKQFTGAANKAPYLYRFKHQVELTFAKEEEKIIKINLTAIEKKNR